MAFFMCVENIRRTTSKQVWIFVRLPLVVNAFGRLGRLSAISASFSAAHSLRRLQNCAMFRIFSSAADDFLHGDFTFF